jgi:hypothetical protein
MSDTSRMNEPETDDDKMSFHCDYLSVIVTMEETFL